MSGRRRIATRAADDHEQQPSAEAEHSARIQRRLLLRARRLGEVADRSRDRHHAHAPGGEGDDDQRQQHPDGEGDEEAARSDCVLDLKPRVRVLCAKGARDAQAPSRKRRLRPAQRRSRPQRGRRPRLRTRTSGRGGSRLVPTARAIPSSPRRSAASMTKIRKMRRIPAAIEKVPKVVKRDMKALPASSASAIASCFAVTTSSPSGAMVGRRVSATWSESPTPAFASPRFETSTCLMRPCLPSRRWASLEGQEERRIGGAGAIEVDDSRDSAPRRALADEDRQPDRPFARAARRRPGR